jgi:porphobilinogen synthase
MYFPAYRPRRLRKNRQLREMIAETSLAVDDLIYPMFVAPGKGVKKEVKSMPGIYQQSVDNLVKEAKEVEKLGVNSILLFGIPEHKDELGTEGYAENGIIQNALRELKKRVKNLMVITDVCMCEYTSHGHCGIIKNGEVDNDETVEYLARMAVSHAEAGADMVAPSDMMDGRVGVIRDVLDESGFEGIPIMSYSAKYASAFYGPFRDAAVRRQALLSDGPAQREGGDEGDCTRYRRRRRHRYGQARPPLSGRNKGSQGGVQSPACRL